MAIAHKMLKSIHIQNYAIIEELEINFSDNLNIITGETGAGKSILMGALNLILGDRADSSVLLQKENKTIVEGSFDIKNNEAVLQFLLLNELDAGEELIIRREVAINGKSRAFINDTPVNISQLKIIGNALVDLHQQFDTLELGSADFQLQALDALADNNNSIKQYQQYFGEYKLAHKELQVLQAKQKSANAELDYNKFLFDELQEANFTENELEDLENELKLLSHAENIKQELSAINYVLNENETPLVQQLKAITGKLNAIEKYHTGIANLSARLQSTQLELADIADEIENINEKINYNAERIQLVTDRISLGYKLQKKHAVQSTNELLGIKEALHKNLANILNIGDAILQKEKQVNVLLQNCEKIASSISVNRKKIIKPFTQNINMLLVSIGMPNARFNVGLQTGISLHQYGIDAIEFLFDANKRGIYEPLSKVASGGELSRLMLCIKSLLAKKLQLPTLIFDEIDTGISGEAAIQVGNIMKGISKNHQIISITHQPQIAARADAHYYVYKTSNKGKMITSIKRLTTDERITSIAQMLAGEKPSEAALQNAKEMVSG